MALKKLDTQRRWKFISALDPSIVSDEAAVAEYRKHYNEASAKKLKLESEPTWFERRALTESMRSAIEDECRSYDSDGNGKVDPHKLADMAFRFGVTNIIDPTIKFETEKQFGFDLVKQSIVDSLPGTAIREIGLLIWLRDSQLDEDEKKSVS